MSYYWGACFTNSVIVARTYGYTYKAARRRVVIQLIAPFNVEFKAIATGVEHFNRDPKKGFEYLAALKLLPTPAPGETFNVANIATFFRRAPGLDKVGGQEGVRRGSPEQQSAPRKNLGPPTPYTWTISRTVPGPYLDCTGLVTAPGCDGRPPRRGSGGGQEGKPLGSC
eukprot:1194472-Prorocentrum_minimum.AAC.2